MPVIPALVLAFYSNREQRRFGAYRVEKDAMRVVQLAAAGQLSLIDATRQHLAALARLPQARGTNLASFNSFFTYFKSVYTNYDDFGLIETNGVLVGSSFGHKGPTNLADRAHFQRVLETQDFVIGNYQAGDDRRKPSLLFGHPVFDEKGRLVRVLYAALDLAVLNNAVARVQLPKGGTMGVYDRSSHILARYPEPEKWIGKPFPESDIMATLIAKLEGSAEMRGLDGVSRLYAFTSLRDGQNANLFVSVGIPTTVAYAEINQILIRNLIILGMLAVFVFITAWGYSNSNILRPVEALANTAKLVAAGDLRARTGIVRASGEMSQLARAFDSMAESLQRQRTETEGAANALREGETRVRAVLNSALSAVVVIDAAGRIMDWNARAERMLGWTRAEALGRVLAETIIPPRYREAHRRGMEHYFASGEGPVLDQLVELSALRRDGTEFPVEVSISPMKAGEVVTFCGFITDITERKRQEEMRARFVAIIQSSDDAIISKTLDGIITSWNPGAERLFGYTADEVLGQPMLTLMPPELLDQEAENLERIARGETVHHYDTVRKRKDGTLVDTAVTISPIRDNLGKVVGASTIARDITERKRAEEQVLLQATALETAANAMLITDRAGTILWTNPAFSGLTGYEPEEVVGRNPRILKSDKHDESFYKDLWSTILSGQTWRGGFTNRRKDGTLYQDEHTITPVRSKDGTITHFIAIMQDVTERNHAQRVLRKSETQLRLVWENALDGMRLVDEEGVIQMVNEAYCRMIGKPRGELEGQPMSVLFEVHRHEEVMRRHSERFQARSIPAHFEKEITLWNGRRLFVELSNSFLEVEDQAPLLFSTFRDITERKRSEKREAAFAKLSQGLSGAPTAAEAARLIAATADELFGWDACTLDVYSGDKDLIHPIINIDTIDGKRVDVPPTYVGQPPTATMRRVVEQGAQLLLRQEPFASDMIPFGNTARPSASLMHVPIRRGNSVIGILSIQSYASNAYDEKALNVLQTLADQCAGALERVRAEEDLRRLNEELERRVNDRTAQLESANKELEAFSYSVSHDLRAPLRHIDGFAEMLRKEAVASLSAPGQRFLGIISQSAKRMGALIDDLLVFSRMGRAALRPTRVRVDELVAEVLHDMTNDFEGRTIKWDIGPLPEVTVDRALFKQVWVNLLANAVKYTRQRAEALIQIRCQKNDQGELEFSVKDNGAGFDMTFAGKLFGVFQRLHQADEFEGTGIGLANVRRIVARHGGRTWAQGKVDAGATFYFTLPPTKPDQKS